MQKLGDNLECHVYYDMDQRRKSDAVPNDMLAE
jgi:hypothetical protein